MAASYVCAQCGGTFDEGWSDELAQQEALETFGRRGDAPGMAKVCDDCYREIMKDIAPLSPLEREYLAQLSAAFVIDVAELENRFINGASTFPGVPVGILTAPQRDELCATWNGFVGRSPIATLAGGLFGSKRYAADDQEPPRPSVQDAVDAALDDRQRDEEGRAHYDQERAQADDDAGNAALGLMHGDGDE